MALHPTESNAIDLSQADKPLDDLGFQDEAQGVDAQQGPKDASGMDMTDAPVPGMSLANDPNAPRPFEGAPQLTTVAAATQALFRGMTSEEGMDQVTNILAEELPIEHIANIFVFEMFRNGMINPDMMLLMVEPTMNILLFIADYADIEVVLDESDELEEEEDDSENEGKVLNAMMNAAPSEISEEMPQELLSLEEIGNGIV